VTEARWRSTFRVPTRRRHRRPQGGPTSIDPLVAIEEMMTAGTLERILDNA